MRYMRLDDGGLKIWASTTDTARFAETWPGCVFRDKSVFVELARNNDLVDLSINDGHGPQDCDTHELNSLIEFVSKDIPPFRTKERPMRIEGDGTHYAEIDKTPSGKDACVVFKANTVDEKLMPVAIIEGYCGHGLWSIDPCTPARTYIINPTYGTLKVKNTLAGLGFDTEEIDTILETMRKVEVK